MDENHAKAILRELLVATSGLVGRFVPVERLASTEPFARQGAAEVVEDLLALRWLRRKDGALAATRPAVEFAIDWERAVPVLKAIADLSDGGRPFRDVTPQAVTVATGFSRQDVALLLNELELLAHATSSIEEGTNREVLQIMRAGLQRIGLLDTFDSPL